MRFGRPSDIQVPAVSTRRERRRKGLPSSKAGPSANSPDTRSARIAARLLAEEMQPPSLPEVVLIDFGYPDRKVTGDE